MPSLNIWVQNHTCSNNNEIQRHHAMHRPRAPKFNTICGQRLLNVDPIATKQIHLNVSSLVTKKETFLFGISGNKLVFIKLTSH